MIALCQSVFIKDYDDDDDDIRHEYQRISLVGSPTNHIRRYYTDCSITE